jgi:dynein heavy chain
MVMEAVMILLGEKIDWPSIKIVLGNVGEFMSRLKGYNETMKKTPEAVFNKVRSKYLSKPEFNAKDVSNKSSACGCLCTWVLSCCKYQIVLKMVGPKQAKLDEVSVILKKAKGELAEKMVVVNEAKDIVAKLEANCQLLNDDKERLEADINRSAGRMGRAEKLVVLLADEGVRWKESVEQMTEDIHKLVGNVFLSCACISYFGAFTGVYRNALVEEWVKGCL